MSYNQNAVIKKLNAYLIIKNRPMSLDHGYCHGLSLLWLYKISRHEENEFYQIVKRLVDTPDEKLPDMEKEIEKFLARIEWLQQPERYIQSIRQMDINQTMEMKKSLPISSIFDPDQLDDVLNVIIQSDKMITLSGPDHTIGVFRRGREYHIYNANYPTGEAKIIIEETAEASIQLIKKEIIQGLFKDFEYPERKLAITINVISPSPDCEDRSDILKMLLNEKGYVYKICDFGLTPLFLAVENNDEELVALLLKKEAHHSQATNDGRMPLLLACYSGYSEIAELLLTAGADPNLEGREGLPLFLACKNNHEAVIETLFSHGADINKQDRDGDSAIFGALAGSHKQLTFNLLERGANPFIIRKNGDTPMDLAIKSKQWDIVAIMLLSLIHPLTKNQAILRENREKIVSATKQLIEAKKINLQQKMEIEAELRRLNIQYNKKILLKKMIVLGRQKIEESHRFFHPREDLSPSLPESKPLISSKY